MDDLIVLADESGVPAGTMAKSLVHTANTPLHLAFSIFIFNSLGEILLQQRAWSKVTWPGVWSNTCCGHQVLGENVAVTAKRRLDHEMGIRDVELHTILPDYRYRAERDGIVENEICPVFVGFSDAEPSIEPSEAEAFCWADWRDVADARIDLSPWATEEAALLDGDPQFRHLLARHTYLS